jgi:hypothetical protein
MKVKCELMRVRTFMSNLVILKSYIETVTVELDTLPHCETRNRSQLLFSAYLSVPHTSAALNPNCDAIRPSHLKFTSMCHFALI